MWNDRSNVVRIQEEFVMKFYHFLLHMFKNDVFKKTIQNKYITDGTTW